MITAEELAEWASSLPDGCCVGIDTGGRFLRVTDSLGRLRDERLELGGMALEEEDE